MTYGELKSRVWDRLGEDSDDPQRFTAAMILSFAKEAIEQWSVAVGKDTSSQSITLTDDTLEYSLSADYAEIVEVEIDSLNFKLKCIHWDRMYRTEGLGRQRRWRDVRSDRPTHYIPFSYDKIWIWPPQSSATHSVTVTTARPVDDDLASGDSDSPSIPRQFHPQLVDYVVGRLLMLNARGERLADAVETVSRWIEVLDANSDSLRNRAHDWSPNPEVRAG